MNFSFISRVYILKQWDMR